MKNSISYPEDIQADIEKIKNAGIKGKDATHIACAIRANADYFITTDDRLIKFKISDIKIVDPMEMIK